VSVEVRWLPGGVCAERDTAGVAAYFLAGGRRKGSRRSCSKHIPNKHYTFSISGVRRPGGVCAERDTARRPPRFGQMYFSLHLGGSGQVMSKWVAGYW
jgi:hypothetical protein